MIPSVRAVADRFIFDTANVKYIAANLPPGGLDRVVASTGWTVRQTVGHVAVSLENYANALEWRIQGVEPDSTGRYPWPSNAETASRTATTPFPDLVALLDGSLVRILAACEPIDDTIASAVLGGRPLLDVLAAMSRHLADHGLDFADALPELRHDPMVLNWLLYADYSDNAERTARQAKLLAEVRDMYAAPVEGA